MNQYLLCIRAKLDVGLVAGRTYTFREDTSCSCGKVKTLSVEEIATGKKGRMICKSCGQRRMVDKYNHLLASRFIPLNDPDCQELDDAESEQIMTEIQK